MKKLSITLLTLSLASTLVAQNTNNKKEEQSENQYKESNNFYINSDGLVVYKRSGSAIQHADSIGSNSHDSIEQATIVDHSIAVSDQPAQSKSSAVIVKKAAYNNDTNQEDKVEPVLIRPEERNQNNEYSAEQSDVDIPYNPVKSSSLGAVKKEALTVDESISINSRAESINSSDDESVNYEAINSSKKEKKNSALTTEEAKKKYKKYNSYEKRPSQYKTLEEAALAVDAMIEELKKNQAKPTGAKSMSSRLSTGANRASLRKKPLSSTSFSASYGAASDTQKPSASNSVNDSDSSWGDEPTYYINGTEVEQTDIDLLKKKDIIRKEFKIRNTISGNPNGEVWYEVQDYKKQ